MSTKACPRPDGPPCSLHLNYDSATLNLIRPSYRALLADLDDPLVLLVLQLRQRRVALLLRADLVRSVHLAHLKHS